MIYWKIYIYQKEEGEKKKKTSKEKSKNTSRFRAAINNYKPLAQ